MRLSVPALLNDEMRAKLDSKVATSCSVAFQLPSVGPRLEQSSDFFTLEEKYEHTIGDFEELAPL